MDNLDVEARELQEYGLTGNKLKELIISKYRKKLGSAPYAKLASFFDFVLVDDDICPTAAVYPGMGKIIVNGHLSNKQLDAVVKHEMMHEWYNHQKRLEEYCVANFDKLCAWLKYDASDVDKHDKNIKSIMRRLHTLSNIAGDYDISNRAYTEQDKEIFRALIHGAEVFKCLVTDDDHPDWVNLSYAEMMDKLVEEEMNKPEPQTPPRQPSNKDKGKSGNNSNSPSSPGNEGNGGGNPGDDENDDDTDSNLNGNDDGQFYNPGGDEVEVIDGEFVDEDTFLDSNGNPITFDESLEMVRL